MPSSHIIADTVPLEFTPEEYVKLMKSALLNGYEDVHDFVLEAAEQVETPDLPDNILPFPSPPGFKRMER